MNYEKALEYIHGTIKFGMKLGLQNISRLLKLMGEPHKKLKYIHVAGTNGKGSTTSMISTILKEAGYKVGMYTSPYIEEFTERIRVDGEKINKNRLAEIATWIKGLIQEMISQGNNHPTEFEIVTAIAFQYFYEQNCDIVVLEVGMGGRFDSTNIIEDALVSVITSIGIDHTKHLGATLENIAYEKAGIIKNSGRVVIYPHQDKVVLDVIYKVACEKKASVYLSDASSLNIISDTLEGTEFSYNKFLKIKLSLIGKHQVYNAITAINAVEVLNTIDSFNITENHIALALAKVKWLGRFEVISRNPLFIIDGAHNHSAAIALKQSINKYLSSKKKVFILGILKDKEYEKVISETAPFADVIITVEPDNMRALSYTELADITMKYCKNVIAEKDICKAINLAIEIAGEEGAICCFGSLYLIGDIRKTVLD
jgi:dihydrofolate synthase/folylpolyglutamate synthase